MIASQNYLNIFILCFKNQNELRAQYNRIDPNQYIVNLKNTKEEIFKSKIEKAYYLQRNNNLTDSRCIENNNRNQKTSIAN